MIEEKLDGKGRWRDNVFVEPRISKKHAGLQLNFYRILPKSPEPPLIVIKNIAQKTSFFVRHPWRGNFLLT